jgi:nucleotide-binding universal stress UspA family protein
MKHMRLLLAYDGSESSNAALEDLLRAGLPSTAEALVMTIADVFLPPPITKAVGETIPAYVPSGVRLAHERAAHELKQAEQLAAKASQRIRQSFPDWTVSYEAVADSPAWAIIRKTDDWRPDLLVMGAHGHSVLGGRLILGSVSQRVLYEAGCSVRIARGRHDVGDPIRLIVGVDGSSNSRAAIDAVLKREWPNGTEVRLLSVVDTVMPLTTDEPDDEALRWIEVGDESKWDQVRELFEPIAEKLRAAGLKTALVIRSGNPKDEIVAEAESWSADAVFLGAKGIRGIEHLLLGSVSAAAAATAPCSVEVVRS